MNSLQSNAVLRSASILLFFFIWQLSSLLFDVELLPGPKEVFIKVIEEAKSSELFIHTFIVSIKFIFTVQGVVHNQVHLQDIQRIGH